MKNIRFVLFVFTMIMSRWAFAYSMPESQFSVRDMKAIFSDSKIGVMIGMQAIQTVSLVAPGVYRISSVDCSIDVRLKNAAPPIPRFIGNGNYMPVVESYENQNCQ
jgi:hypothetical protein